MEFCFLGTSGALPYGDNTTTSIFIKKGKVTILIDCPGDSAKLISSIGFSPQELDYLIITHAHPDHIYGLPFLMQNLMLMGREKPLYILANQETMAVINGLLSLFGFDGILPFETIMFTEKNIESMPQTGEMEIVLIPVDHAVPTSGVLLNTENHKLFYTSDTSPIPEILKTFSPITVLIHEASGFAKDEEYLNINGHSSVRQAVAGALTSTCEKLFLCHFDSQVNILKEKTIFEALSFTNKLAIKSNEVRHFNRSNMMSNLNQLEWLTIPEVSKFYSW
ncbi:MAG: MBL fold metallo-hydrolase [Spirochaetia bacterium]|nr:MBL fold metallo-hydrolase [Spirochaetia bacterium]